MADVFKMKRRDGELSPQWYGKVKTAAKTWGRVTLFTDKSSSRRRLAELQREADQRQTGILTPDTDRLALPIADLSTKYIDGLKLEARDVDHIRIAEWMNKKLIELGGWKFFRDITRDSVEKILATLDAQGKTVSYRNKFITRAKAFVNWALPDGAVSPLKKLKRIREKGAKKTRERQAASTGELAALMNLDLPDDRRLGYALAAFNGMRRNEVARLKWDDLSTAATIPFVKLRRKQGQDDTPDYVPIHPYVLTLLAGRLAMPEAKVVAAVPDVSTLEKDWTRASVNFKDAQGRRLDYHALRHTFQSNLDQTGCSRATKKKLMRHANEDVTDGYAHAELAEMLSALRRLPSPLSWGTAVAVRTGTDSNPVSTDAIATNNNQRADHRVDQSSTAEGQVVATTADGVPMSPTPCEAAQPLYDERVVAENHQVAQNDANSFIDNDLRPSTQVD